MLKRILILAIGLLLIWQAIVWAFNLPAYFLPSPIAVFTSLVDNQVLIIKQLYATIIETLIGWFIAIVFGSITAIVMMMSSRLKFWLLPIIVMSQAIPTMVLAPILIVWFGYGMTSKIAIIVLALFFPITTNFYSGLRTTPMAMLEQAKLMQASLWTTMLKVRIPAAMPSLVSGVKIATAWAPMAAVIGEWMGSSRGIGYLMMNANARMDVALLFSSLLMLVIFSLSLYFLIEAILKQIVYW